MSEVRNLHAPQQEPDMAPHSIEGVPKSLILHGFPPLLET